MRFITAVEQLKEANSAISVDFSLNSIASYIREVEFTLLFILGEEAATEIEAFPNALNTLRRSIVDISLSGYSSSGAILISDSGITVSKGENHLPASDKKLLNFRTDSANRGWQAFEQLIAIMEAKPEAFPLWRASQKRRNYFSTLFFNSGEFSSFGGIGISASLFRVLKPQLQRVQEDVLYTDFGEELVDGIIAKRLEGTLNVDDRKLERKLMQVLAPLALVDAIPYQMIQIQEGAVFTASISALSSNSDNVQQFSAAEMSKLRALMLRLSTEGEAKRVSTLKWLKENASKFSLFDGVNKIVYPFENMNDKDSNVYFL